MPNSKKPRASKTKAQLTDAIRQQQNIAKWVVLTKQMWPLVESQEKIYDTQTVFHAVSGYIELGLKIKDEELKVGNLGIDMSKEKDSSIKKAMTDIFGMIENENARDMMNLMRKIADHIGQYGASEFVKQPMSAIKVTDLVK